MDHDHAGLPQRPHGDSGAQAAILYLDIRVPAQLGDLVQRHYEHLARLAWALHKAGVEEAHIKLSVDQLVDQYRAELVEAITHMNLGMQDG